MGMKYLMRAARRLSTAIAPAAGAPKLRPAMPSRSPLAEADQRLNIDSFAAHFDVPSARERPEAAGENEPVAPSDSNPHGPIEGPRAPMDEARIVPPGPGMPAVRTESKRESVLARARRVNEPPRQALPPSAARLTRPQAQTAAGDSGTLVPEKPAPSPDRPAAGPPDRRVNSPPEPAAGARPLPGNLRREPPHAAAREPAAPGERPADPMMDALSRAMRWVEGRPSTSGKEERVERRPDAAPQAPQARLGEIAKARPLRPPLRDARPITHLEIGKIEVEVVQPVKPASSGAAPRPGQKAAGFPNTSRRAFGWRQR